MKNSYCFRKAFIIFSAAAIVCASGIPGVTAVTAWADPSSAVVAVDEGTVRESAVDGEAIDTLVDGKEVTILDSTTGSDGEKWYEIQYTSGGNEFTGWMRGDLLDVEGEEEEVEEELLEDVEDEELAREEAEETLADEIEEDAEEEAKRVEEENAAKSTGTVTYVIASSIPSDVIPDGFQLTTVSYEGKDVPALVMNNAEVYLLYMEDASKTAPGRLVVYDIDKAELIPYINFETKDGFILLLNIPDAELTSVSDRFIQTTCEFEEGTMDALQMSQADSIISESANISDFYYMYGVNRDGMYGWYTYDDVEGTIQENILSMHYNLNGTTVAAEEENSGFSLDSLSLVVIVGIIVILLLLVVLVIIFGIRYRQLAREMDRRKGGKGSKKSGGSGSGKQPQRESSDRYGDDFGLDDFDSDDDFSFGGSDQTFSGQRSQPASYTDRQSYDFSDGVEKDDFVMPTEALRQAQDTQRPTQPSQAASRKPKEPPKSDDDDLEFL